MHVYAYIVLLPSVYGKNYIITGPCLSTTHPPLPPTPTPTPTPPPYTRAQASSEIGKKCTAKGRIPFTVNDCYRLKVITQNRFFPSPGERKRADIS